MDLSEIVIPILDGVLELMPDERLPDPDRLSYYVLEKKRIIYLDYDIGPGVMMIHRMIVRWNMEDIGKPVEERVPIKLLLMSTGGSLDYMWAMVDDILASKTPVYTYNLSDAHSAASIIFMAGQKRFMMPHASIVVHQGSGSFAGDAGKIFDQTEAYREELKRMRAFILERTDIPKATLTKHASNDWTLTAEECLKYNVCTDVIQCLEDVIQ